MRAPDLSYEIQNDILVLASMIQSDQDLEFLVDSVKNMLQEAEKLPFLKKFNIPFCTFQQFEEEMVDLGFEHGQGGLEGALVKILK